MADALWRSALRRVFSLYYREGHVYRMPLGPLRGLRVRYTEGLTYHNVLGLKDVDAFGILSRLRPTVLADVTTIADIGAQYGLYSLWFAREFARDGLTVHAFEPAPATFARLSDNIALNAMTALIRPHNVACSDSDGTADFFIRAAGSSNTLLDVDDPSAQRTSIQTVTLDHYLVDRGLPAPQLMKIDVEGAGGMVLAGAQRVLAETRPVILMDSHDHGEDRAMSDVCLTHGYAAYRITNGEWVREVDEIHPHPQGVWGTLLLVPREQESATRAVLG